MPFCYNWDRSGFDRELIGNIMRKSINNRMVLEKNAQLSGVNFVKSVKI